MENSYRGYDWTMRNRKSCMSQGTWNIIRIFKNGFKVGEESVEEGIDPLPTIHDWIDDVIANSRPDPTTERLVAIESKLDSIIRGMDGRAGCDDGR